VQPESVGVAASGGGVVEVLKIGTLSAASPAGAFGLEVFWIDDYAGGVFIPFRDASNGSSTYEGGRYLLDTGKGADLGREGSSLVIDFNFAYQPSCAHDPRWSCPLAPDANNVPYAVPVGELCPD